MRAHQPERPRALAAGVAAVALVGYGARVCPTAYVGGDSNELVAAAVAWGVPHAPGYPLWTTLAHLASRLPLGEPTWRVHATSAALHAATLFVVTLAGAELAGSAVAGLAAAAALGLSRTFFLGSLYAEVFPLHDLLLAASLWLALRLARAPRGGGVPPVAWAFVVVAGVASAHHQTIALAAPGLALLVVAPLLALVRARPARLAGLAAAFVAPVALAAALVVVAASRHPVPSFGDVHDLASLARLATRADYGGLLRASRHGVEGHHAARLVAWTSLFASSVGVVASLLGAWGLARGALERRLDVAAVALVWLGTGPAFAVVNWLFAAEGEERLAFAERFVAAPHVPFALLVAVGVASAPARAKVAAGWLATAALVVAGLAAVRGLDLAHDRRGEALAHDLLRPAEPGALVLVRGDLVTGAAAWACVVERACAERTVLAVGELFLPWRRAQVAREHPDLALPWGDDASIRRTHELVAREIGRRPVYAVPDYLAVDPELARAFAFRPVGLLVRLYATERDADADAARLRASARGLLDGTACEGCAAVGAPGPHPSQSVQLDATYAAALDNHAVAARERLADPALAAALHDAAERARRPAW